MSAKVNFTQFYLQHALLHTPIRCHSLFVSAGASFMKLHFFHNSAAYSLDQLAVTWDTPL
eukprot:12937632-Prorocentrum_lima.AAC.1